MTLSDMDWSVEMFCKTMLAWCILPIVFFIWPVLYIKYELIPSIRPDPVGPSNESDLCT